MTARPAECRCEANFTCGYCLRNAKPWLWTDCNNAQRLARCLAKSPLDTMAAARAQSTSPRFSLPEKAAVNGTD